LKQKQQQYKHTRKTISIKTHAKNT